MTLGCSLHVSHKFSICLTHKITSPQRRQKHVVASGKQHIIGVDGVDDVEAYNNYDEMLPFTDFPKKISVVEKNLELLNVEMLLLELLNMECLCKCVFVRLHLCMRVRLYIYVCV